MPHLAWRFTQPIGLVMRAACAPTIEMRCFWRQRQRQHFPFSNEPKLRPTATCDDGFVVQREWRERRNVNWGLMDSVVRKFQNVCQTSVTKLVNRLWLIRSNLVTYRDRKDICREGNGRCKILAYLKWPGLTGVAF